MKPGGGLIGAGADAGATGGCGWECGWDCGCGLVVYCWGGAMGLEACSGWKDEMFEEKDGTADLDGWEGWSEVQEEVEVVCGDIGWMNGETTGACGESDIL